MEETPLISKMSNRVTGIDAIVRAALETLSVDLESGTWNGRENEAVNLFAFRHLLQQINPSGPLRDPTQIGIEVAVPQLPGKNRKKLVRKDLVIWPEPGMNCWDTAGRAINLPIAIMEWKANRSSRSDYDIDWLRQTSGRWRDFVGYAVTIDLKRRKFLVQCARLYRGEIQSPWFSIGS